MSSRDIDESSENVLSEWPNQAEPEVDADEQELGTTDDDGAPAWGTASATAALEDADAEVSAVAEPEPTLEPEPDEVMSEPETSERVSNGM